jgi:hypothetical protein
MASQTESQRLKYCLKWRDYKIDPPENHGRFITVLFMNEKGDHDVCLISRKAVKYLPNVIGWIEQAPDLFTLRYFLKYQWVGFVLWLKRC